MFKVGDKVKVVRRIAGFTHGWTDGWTDSMNACVGYVYTISRVADGNRHYLSGSGYNFPKEALEYANPQEDLPMELTEEQAEALHQKAEKGERLSRAEYKWFIDNGFDRAVEDYIEPEDAGGYFHTDDLFYCELGDQWYASDDDFETYNDRYGNCGKAHRTNLRRNGNYFHCWHTNEWWSDHRYTRIYLEDMGEWVCLDEVQDRVYFCEDDDNYYWYEDNMPNPNSIPQYHTQSRNWKVPDGVTFGIELEVYVEDAEQAYANRVYGIIGERDGSLDDYHGVEFIGPPMLYDDYFKHTNPWKRTLEAIRDAGVPDKQGDGYGIHISVGRAALSSEVQARFILFINNCQDFSEWIADRPQNRWAEYDKKDVAKVTQAMRVVGNDDYWGSKYAATHVTSNRIEVRIFRSTTDDMLFQKNIDYVASAVQYAEEHLFVEDMMSVSNYLAWLNKQEKYAALRAFVADKGKEFAEQDERRKQLAQSGFIIEATDEEPTLF